MTDEPTVTHLRVLVAFARPNDDSHVALALVEPAVLDEFIATILGERPDRTPGIEPTSLALRSAVLEDSTENIAEFWSNPDIQTNTTYEINSIVSRVFGDALEAPIRGNVIITGPADPEQRTIADAQDWVLEQFVEMGVVATEVDGTTRVAMSDLLRF